MTAAGTAREVRWTLGELRDVLRAAPEFFEHFAWEAEGARLDGESLPRVRTALRSLRSLALAVSCCFLEHRIVDGGSCCGPDSGREVLCCSRCGRTMVDVVYY